MRQLDRLLIVTILISSCRFVMAKQPIPLQNGGFEKGLTGWVFRPGEDSQVSLLAQDGPRGQILRLHPDGRLLGVETEHLVRGRDLCSEQAYQVQADLKFEGLQSGVFAFSMYCFDSHGKSLKQIVFYGLNPKSAVHDWRTVRGTFGPGTQQPLPEGTQSVRIRFSFYAPGGDCRGDVLVDNVMLQPYQPAVHEGWPAGITADVGQLQVRFESRSFWTLYRIDYKGTRLCMDRWGSHYGSVVRFPGVGFIGSGHTENEGEQILELKLVVDGRSVDRPEATIRCQRLKLLKKSRIRSFVLVTEIGIQGNRIEEDVRITAEKVTPVNLIYHFMHPWVPSVTEYLAELPDGTLMEGKFQGDGGQKIDRPVRWSAVYDGPSGMGAVTYVLDVPAVDKWRTRYWDVPDRYRKHYLTAFLNSTVPANQEFHYRVVTVPFEADQSVWKKEAARVAAHCRTANGE